MQRELLDGLFVLAGIFTPEGTLLETNERAIAAFGLSREQVLGTSFERLADLVLMPQSMAEATRLLHQAASGTTARGELVARFSEDAAVLDCTFRPLRDASGRVVQVAAVGTDVTPYKRTESALAKLNRELRLVSGCNRLLVREQEEQALLDGLCRVIVEDGGYCLAWVGYAEADAEKSVRCVASAGLDRGYLSSAHITWADNALGRGPTGRGIRTGSVEVCRDIGRDPLFAPWADEARRRGYTSSIALPIMIDRRCAGALNVYSDAALPFDEAEVQLLSELTRDLAYGIEGLRTRAERRRQREQIERLARILRMQSGINSAVLRIHEQDELLQEACRLATEVGGYDRAVFSVVDAGGKHAVPRFRAGAAEDFPEPPRLEIGAETGLDVNLTGRALRTGRIAVSTDLTLSEPPVALRESLVRLGYKAMIALPLIVEGRRVAALVLTTRDADLATDNELLVLLQDMMASLSFALRSKEHAATAEYLAYFDTLTGLAKRALFVEHLQGLLRRELGPQGEIAVIAFDIRGLNRINDTFGRHFGDQVLQKVSARLKEYARTDAHIGYLGGGTFAVVEPPLAAGDQSMRSVLDANLFAEVMAIEGQTLRLSCSYGVAHFPQDALEGDALIQRAEAALKQAKESGERYLHYRLEMHSEIAERLDLEHKLSEALEGNQFALHYQPQLGLKSGRIEALEGLLRWNDPADGLVLPQKFLAVLESTGMIVAVGEWALQRAVEDCERWSRMGFAPLRVAINVSAVQLRQRGFVQIVLQCRDRLAACPGFGLDLEITESTWLQDMEGTSGKLSELRAAGVRIALDDFGTGYSSLGLLSRLPVDLLKIDRSFIRGLPGDAASVTLVETILRLASAFKLTTVVEGVETTAQLDALTAMKCDLWQGYLHSPPVAARELESRLARR